MIGKEGKRMTEVVYCPCCGNLLSDLDIETRWEKDFGTPPGVIMIVPMHAVCSVNCQYCGVKTKIEVYE